jgi:TonB-dependent receptor
VHWILNYSDALQDRPDDAQYSLLNHVDRNGNIPSQWGTGDASYSWRWNDDRQYLANADLTYKLTSDETHVIHAGGGYTGLKRANFQNDFSMKPALDPTTGRTPPFTEIDSMKFNPTAAITGNPVFNYQNYKAQEALLSGYVEYTLNTGALQVLAGVRWEQATDQFWTAAPITDRYNSDTVKFIDLLPSAHIRYAFSSEHIMRLSVTKTMSRPSYFDLVPAQDVGDVNVNKGNPDLKAAHSTNVDLQYEYVTSTTDQFSITFYKKHITDAIQKSVSGSTVSTTTMTNGPPADVYGAEISALVHIGNIGISANYAQAYSRTTDQVTVVTLGTDMWGELGPVNAYVTRTRPLQDQSPVLANATLSYGNKQWGTGVQVSYNYTGRRLVGVGSQDGLDVYENGVGDMDFSADQIILQGIKLSVKLSNILNSIVVREAPSGAWMVHAPLLVEQDYNKFRGTIGVSFLL